MSIIQANIIAALLLLATWSSAAKLSDVKLTCKTGCTLEFQFQAKQGLPSYYQKMDAQTNEFILGFSSTDLPVESGEYQVDGKKSSIKSMKISSETRKGGIVVSVFRLSLVGEHAKQAMPVELKEGSRFIVSLPLTIKGSTWSLKKAKVPPKDTALKASAPAKKIPEVKTPEVSKVETFKAETVKTTTPKVAETTSVVVSPTANDVIQSFEWIRSNSLEQFTIQFVKAEDANNWIRNFRDSILLLPVQNTIASTRIEPKSALLALLQVEKKGTQSNLKVKFKEGARIVLLRKNRVIWQQKSSNETSIQVIRLQKNGKLLEENFAILSEDLNLISIEQFANGMQKSPISTSQTFPLRKGVRDLIVVEENVAMRQTPSEQGLVMIQLQFGDALQSLSLEGLYYKVKLKELTGYINKREVSYRDELSPTQEEKYQQVQVAKKAAMEAARLAGIPLGGDSLSVQFDSDADDRITYSSFGRRDPFVDLKGVVSKGIDIDGAELVGIIWESEVPMVLLVDSRNPGVSYTLKEGDSILNGKVLKITQEEVLFLINEYGVSRRYTMTLPNKYGGKKK